MVCILSVRDDLQLPGAPCLQELRTRRRPRDPRRWVGEANSSTARTESPPPRRSAASSHRHRLGNRLRALPEARPLEHALARSRRPFAPRVRACVPPPASSARCRAALTLGDLAPLHDLGLRASSKAAAARRLGQLVPASRRPPRPFAADQHRVRLLADERRTPICPRPSRRRGWPRTALPALEQRAISSSSREETSLHRTAERARRHGGRVRPVRGPERVVDEHVAVGPARARKSRRSRSRDRKRVFSRIRITRRRSSRSRASTGFSVRDGRGPSGGRWDMTRPRCALVQQELDVGARRGCACRRDRVRPRGGR